MHTFVSYNMGMVRRYILHPKGAIFVDTIDFGIEVPIKKGNALPLTDMPLGTTIHDIEITLGKGGQLARAVGVVLKLIAKEGKSATLKLHSREVRLISKNSSAIARQVGNVATIPIGVVKEGPQLLEKTPATPLGYPVLGRRSRKRNKYSDNFIIHQRTNHLLRKIEKLNTEEEKRINSNLVTGIYHYTHNDWSYNLYL
ncbi:50S ribosomal protein L2 chloroplastic [Bienertia sinuspersici]